MTSLGVVARREYRETVRKKWFVIWTVLTPLLFGSVMLVPALLLSKSGGTKRVLILDGTKELAAALQETLRPAGDDASGGGTASKDASEGGGEGTGAEPSADFTLEVRGAEDAVREAETALEDIRRGDVDVIVAVPADILTAPDGTATYYSRSATDIVTRQILAAAVSHVVLEQRVRDRGIEADDAKRLLKRVPLVAMQVTQSKEARKVGDFEFFVAFAFAGMIVLPTLFHGREIMSGIVLEKSERIVESLVSSISAFDLLTGKVLGLAGVGLTQIAIWSAMGSLTSAFSAPMMLGMNLHTLALFTPTKLFFFVVFYLLGYLTNACVYAAGGACSNSEKEAQQITQPIVLALMLPWFLVGVIVTNPDSPLATALSLIPVYTPITMFIRIIVGDPPVWQIAVSIVLSCLSILGLFWIASRIFRVGILWYGKRPSLPEFIRWMRRA